MASIHHANIDINALALCKTKSENYESIFLRERWSFTHIITGHHWLCIKSKEADIHSSFHPTKSAASSQHLQVRESSFMV